MPSKKGSPGLKKYLKWFWVLVVLPPLSLVLLVIGTAYEWFGELPSFEDLENPNSSISSEVYSADGVVLGKYYFQNRSNVHYSELSPNIVRALKATEDIRFEEHSGVDLRGLLRVLFKTVILRQSNAGGGSTITQQLAKNLFPRENISGIKIIMRKIQEWIIAVRLEKSYTKNEIIAMYLNTVEFGSNTFGIKSASRTFFDKAPSELNVQEAAVLTGLLKAPTYYSPIRNPKNSTARRNTVLAQMYKYDFLTDHQFDSLKAMPIRLRFQAEDHNAGMATYFRESLRLELVKWCREHKKADGTSYSLYRDGLKIYTTIDSRMQRYAEEAVKEHLTDLQKQFKDHWKGKVAWAQVPEVIDNGMKQSYRYAELKGKGVSEDSIKKNFNTKIPMTIFSWNGEIDTMMSPLDSIKYFKQILQTGFMSMDPHTGYVRAWVGGNNYEYFKYDHVKEGKRQVGSTFKPFLYTLAVQEGYSPCYKIPNIPVTIMLPTGESWTPKNAEPEYGGMMTLKEALANSINCISAYLMKQFGPEAMIDIARKMGITSPIDPVPAICLGTPDISVYEMVGAYSTFANKGVWTEPIYLTRIEDKNGVVLQDFVPKKVEAISEETAYVMLSLLQGVVQYGTSVRLRYKYGFANPIAGKTGTTQEYSDGWFMGITPDLVSGCWVGCEDRSIHFRSITLGQGANMALPIWALYMKKVYADKALNISQGTFERPPGKLSIELDCSKYQNTNQINPNDSDFGF
ncbi:MAG TPA: transglycosylase domain-containing protein [Bacteroidia bacterium]|nr:transglycosylase domain-containing protein [Bacteroidia bacterium]